MKYVLLLSIVFCFSLSSIAQEKADDEYAYETEIIFSSQDKDYLQLWHYEQLLQMSLNQEGRDNYLSLLNYYTYKMSRLGLKKYGYTDAQRKQKFDGLVKSLNADMKDLLSKADYKIHKDSFKKIVKLVYDKRNWE
ncbi:hypothetical protein [Aequorivita marina]|uniref:hypothetical protein n=1 Tax=Aequorivita marina TaxID=3073654 RepID=UPI002875863A|nr:hypothetical protein [Aequorivita sp. S2608]MDS1299467.1 hypothetical protein [Aequorivita sp. S2608]